MSQFQPMLTFLSVLKLARVTHASININTLPPDLRRFEFLDNVPPRSTINPVWSGDYSAALDGEQNKVLVSWTVLGPDDGIEFQVCDIMSHGVTHATLIHIAFIPRMLFMQNSFILN